MPETATFRVFLLLALLATSATALGGGKVGGRTPIRDVKNNREIQQLGEYCVQEYNKGLTKQHQKGSDSAPLVFGEVVAAEKQVVSGIKYYLKISATTTTTTGGSAGGIKKKFDAEIVVKPWARSKELLNFSPSPSPATK